MEGCEVARGNQRLYSKKRFSSVHCTNLCALYALLQYRISIYTKFTHVSISLHSPIFIFISRSKLSRHPIIFISHSKMNWTGGRLSRHSRRADSSTTSKQKQHFAKMRNHLMSGSVKKGLAKRPNLFMAAPQPPDELPVRDGTGKTELQHPLPPLNHDLHTYQGLYGENKLPGIYLPLHNGSWERPNRESR